MYIYYETISRNYDSFYLLYEIVCNIFRQPTIYFMLMKPQKEEKSQVDKIEYVSQKPKK